MYRILSFCLFVLVIGFATNLPAQTTDASPSPTPVNPELQELIDQNAILEQKKKAAEAEKAIAEAQKAEFAAKYPKPSVTPLSGTTTIDAGVKIESQMMAYRAMAGNADRVAFEIKAVPMKKLAIFSSDQVKLLQNYAATREQLALMLRGYQEQIPVRLEVTGAIPALAAGTSLVGSVADLLSFFRTDTDIKGQSYTISESSLASEIFRAIRRPDSGFERTLELYYPFEFAPRPTGLEKYTIIEKIEELNRERLQASVYILQIDELVQKKEKAEAKIKEFQARAKAIPAELVAAQDALTKFETINRQYPSANALEKEINAKKVVADLKIEEVEIPQEIDKQKRILDGLNSDIAGLQGNFANGKAGVAYVKALNAQFDKFYSEITTVTSGTNPLALYLQAEQLRAALGCNEDNPKCPDAHLLAIKVLEAGGNNRTKKNLITTVFTGPDITHSGGAIVEYRLYDLEGKMKLSNTFTNYEYYRKSKNIAKMANEEIQDESQKEFEKKSIELEIREKAVKAREDALQKSQKKPAGN